MFDNHGFSAESLSGLRLYAASESQNSTVQEYLRSLADWVRYGCPLESAPTCDLRELAPSASPEATSGGD